jgi:hypothetical protein
MAAVMRATIWPLVQATQQLVMWAVCKYRPTVQTVQPLRMYLYHGMISAACDCASERKHLAIWPCTPNKLQACSRENS